MGRKSHTWAPLRNLYKTSSLRTLNIMPRNLNTIVRSRIRLLERDATMGDKKIVFKSVGSLESIHGFHFVFFW